MEMAMWWSSFYKRSVTFFYGKVSLGYTAEVLGIKKCNFLMEKYHWKSIRRSSFYEKSGTRLYSRSSFYRKSVTFLWGSVTFAVGYIYSILYKNTTFPWENATESYNRSSFYKRSVTSFIEKCHKESIRRSSFYVKSVTFRPEIFYKLPHFTVYNFIKLYTSKRRRHCASW